MIAETDSNNNIIAWYTPGICETRWINGAWRTFYYACDDLGSTRQLTDSMQRVTDAYAYNAWGEEMGELGPPVNGLSPENPLRFVGKLGCYSDGKYSSSFDDTGLVLMGARYYDPLLGRFITQDPKRDGLNWYAYAGNNPVNRVDPTGLERQPLSRQQRQSVDRALSYVEHTPYYASYGKDLRHMFNVGHIEWDNEAFGNAIAFGLASISNYIVLGNMYNDDSLNSMTEFRGTLRLASSLVHEQTHNYQGGNMNFWQLPTCELGAYAKQMNYFWAVGQSMMEGADSFWGAGRVLEQRRQGLSEIWGSVQGEAKEALQGWGLDSRLRSWGFQ